MLRKLGKRLFAGYAGCFFLFLSIAFVLGHQKHAYLCWRLHGAGVEATATVENQSHRTYKTSRGRTRRSPLRTTFVYEGRHATKEFDPGVGIGETFSVIYSPASDDVIAGSKADSIFSVISTNVGWIALIITTALQIMMFVMGSLLLWAALDRRVLADTPKRIQPGDLGGSATVSEGR